MISSAKVPMSSPRPSRGSEDPRSSGRPRARSAWAGGRGSDQLVGLPADRATPEREPGAKGAKPLAPLPESNSGPLASEGRVLELFSSRGS